MKTLVRILAVGLIGTLGLGNVNAPADVGVSVGVQINAVSDFYEPLAAEGAWVEVGSYGRCWHPARVAVGWRPYCYGHWEWTDCGWYWVSDEPWAWACYHYGTWVYDSDYGWVWVPGIEWAPAWVFWREGGGHIGWAPCPPHGARVASSAYVFVETSHFRRPVRPSTVIVNNPTIIKETTRITGFKREKRNIGGAGPREVVINKGPSVEMVQKAAGGKITAVPAEKLNREMRVPSAMSHHEGKPPRPKLPREKAAPPAPEKHEPAPPEQPGAPHHELTPPPTGPRPAEAPAQPHGEKGKGHKHEHHGRDE